MTEEKGQFIASSLWLGEYNNQVNLNEFKC